MNDKNFRPLTNHARLNQFAIRCFRDTGDADYIAARLSIRSGLAAPFLWSAEQAIEKYLKCILMLNRKKTGDLSHNLLKALTRINTELPFKIELDVWEKECFDHIVEWNGDRYLLQSYELIDIELLRLDRLVWKLRQYCRPLDVEHYADNPSNNVLLASIQKIESRMAGPAKNGHIPGGLLEKILSDKTHRSRPALVWKNAWYCATSRTKILYKHHFVEVNSPLWLNPELAEEAAKWMRIPEEVVQGAKLLAASRARHPK